MRLRRARTRLYDSSFLLALLCDVCLGDLLAGLFIVAPHRIHAQAIMADSPRIGFRHLLFTYNFLSAGHDTLRLFDRGICSDDARTESRQA